jgi:S-adenosylmethionine synthetase
MEVATVRSSVIDRVRCGLRHGTGDLVSSSWTFTSESVTEGHPDKMADQISDSILDAMLEQDPNSRVACETFVTTGLAIVGGEITTSGYVDIPKVVRNTINEIGYNRESYGYDGSTVGVLVSLDEQSPDIAQGVDDSEEVRSGTSGEDLLNKQGAGDQGMMFGYACDETEELMPLPIHLAHRMAERLAEVRRAGTVPYLRPDGKTQVTFDYEDGKPVRLRTVLISTQHNDGIDRDEVIRPDLIEHVIRPVVPEQFANDDYGIFVNPTGRFVIGGPVGDAGLTGRKIIVDTYGGMGRHGGGAFSGKDPSKVDRSAAYAARWVAKNVVAAGAASRCEVQVAYAIGVAQPVSIMVETFGTETVENSRIVDAVTQVFDLRPAAILRDLDLRRPIYKRTAAYGHFGRPADDGGFTWERLDKVDDLRSALGL